MSADQVIAIAKAEVGYLEKATNSNLDSKTGNAGSNNYTKFARDLNAAGYYNGNKNGYAWCDVFVDWCFFKAYGTKAKAEAVQCQTGTLGAGCEYSLAYYKQAGRFSQTPQKGDQIFFKDSSGEICHTGLVVDVTASTVYTIEGNTSGASGVVSNGGGVAAKSYAIGYGRIAGYGHPKYEAETKVTEGWQQDDTGWWYRLSDGSWPKFTWKKISKKWYYFGSDGYMVTDAWQRYKGAWYYLGSSGAMITDTTIRIDSSGKMVLS